MAAAAGRIFIFIVYLLPLMFSSPAMSSSFGINYGQVANNLPTPTAVIPLLHSIGVSKVKLYDSDPAVLRAFSGTGVEFTIGIPDRCITKLAHSQAEALLWVKYNVLPYLPGTKISVVTIGNEVLTGDDTSNFPCLLPAMQNVHSALASLNLDHQIVVTTAHSLAVLAASYPPSSARFKKEINPYICQMLDFLIQTGSPFLINSYPYFAYKDDPKGVSLDYVLLDPNCAVVVDPKTGAKYNNMLHAQVDALYTAIDAAVGKEKGKCVKVSVSETGWPSKGDEDEAGATLENAKRYNGNLVKMVEEKKGTPMRPDAALEVYIFAMFNENLKPGPASERNYGLFKPDGTPAYQLGVYSTNTTSSSGSSGGGNGKGLGDGADGFGLPEGDSSSTGYYSISDATKVGLHYGVVRLVALLLFVNFGLFLTVR